MQAISRDLRLLWDALFLQRDAYATMRDDNNPFVEGLFILVVLGVVLALVGIVGTTLEWASSPSLDEIRDTVLGFLQQMQWWQFMEQSPESMQMFRTTWDQVWRFVGMAAPSPATSLAGIITKPLGLIIGWLLYGAIAHLLARLLGGKGNVGQTLGTTALAAAPQMLNVVTVLPFTVVAGLGTWTLLCNYMALRTAHDLSWPRAMWAALLPPIILGVIVGALVAVLLAIFGASMAALFAGGQ